MVPLEKTKAIIGKLSESIRANESLLKKLIFALCGVSIILSLVLSTYSCSVLYSRIGELQNELDSITTDLNAVIENDGKVSPELQSFDDLKVKILTELAINKLKMEQYTKAVFNAADAGKGFARVDSNTGMFFLILDKTESSSNGYKLYFRLGNPQNCVYSNPKILIRWGEKYDRENKDTSMEEWEKSLKNSEIILSDPLLPGQWSSFDITISPAKSEDIQYVEVKIQAEQISMQKSKE